MALPNFEKDVAVIQKLGTFPNQEQGLTADEMKAKFDEAALAIKDYINQELVSAIQDLQENSVTDEHINSLIDEKLGVIENGTY